MGSQVEAGTTDILALWPHQDYAIKATIDAIAKGQRRICLTSPTGGGKTRIMAEVIRYYLDAGLKVILYTNRKMLLEQTSEVFGRLGLAHGTRAAGYDRDSSQRFQVSSIQTEHARVTKGKSWAMFEANLVVLDEAHQQTGKMVEGMLKAHLQAGAAYLGITATPLDIGHLYDHLIVAGKTSELRDCGALVRAMHYAPDEPDPKEIKTPLGTDIPEGQVRKAMMTPSIFGRVLKHYRILNTDQRPTLLFAPGVAESYWFAQQFQAAGISAAHIDGKDVWIRGNLYRSSPEAREEALEGSKDGSIKVLCNRFVLREGIDCPWLAHGIFATIFGSLQSYLQSGGRILRSYPFLEHVTIQDHGGNWWRNGSLNADREWSLDWNATIVAGLREERLRAKREKEPFLCPKCRLVMTTRKCFCGWEVPEGWKRSRFVVQTDDELREVKGDIFRPRLISKRTDGPYRWKAMYYRSISPKAKGRTFRAAAALFAREGAEKGTGWFWPDPKWPFMPLEIGDWFKPVRDVPIDRLTK